MQYDPIKESLGKVFNRSVFSRKLLYTLLDILLLRAWHIKRELKNFKKYLDNDSWVLDAGAGFGQYSYFLSGLSEGPNILAVDLKSEQVDDCNRFFGQINRADRVRFEEADLRNYRVPGKYDLVLSVDVLEHIAEDEKVFENFMFSLKKGGMLLISTPSNLGGSDVHRDLDESFIDEHVRDGYNIKEIEEKLRLSGFSRVESKYIYGWPGRISWMLSMKYPMVLLNMTKLFFAILPFYYFVTFPFSLFLNFIDVNKKHKTGTGLIVKAWK